MATSAPVKTLDELDVKIFRALISESAIAPTNVQVRSSLRAVARRLGADDMTVRNRFRKLQEWGCMTEWPLSVNPRFLGYGMLDLLMDVEPEYGKPDMMRKLRLVHEVVVMINFLGRALKVIILYNSEESRSRSVELVSRITNAQDLMASRMALPASQTERLSETEVTLIRSLAKDARKPASVVAGELGIATRTVRNRIERLRKQNTVFTFPNLNMSNITGFIPVVLTYAYARPGAKSSVDRAMLSHFDANYLWGGFYDPEHAFIVLSAPAIADVPRFREWAKSQPGVATARVDVPVELISFPEKFRELLAPRQGIPVTRSGT